MSLIDFPLSPSVGQSYSFGTKTWTWNGIGWIASGGGPTGPTGTAGSNGAVGATGATGPTGGNLSLPQGRVTFVTGTPVMGYALNTGRVSHLYTPYLGSQIPIYDGTSWTMRTFSEMSQLNTDTTKSPAAASGTNVYDIFVWDDSGTLRATRGPAWNSSTTRGSGAGTTELDSTTTFITNKNAITNGPGANRGTYVGTIQSNGDGTYAWTTGSSPAAGGSAAALLCWNMYNRVEIEIVVQDSTDSWTLAGPATRQANNSAGMQVTFVTGLADDTVSAMYSGAFLGGTGSLVSLGVSFDNSATMQQSTGFSNTTSAFAYPVFGFAANNYLGAHLVYAVERVNSAVTVTFYGDGGAPPFAQNGLYFKARM